MISNRFGHDFKSVWARFQVGLGMISGRFEHAFK